MTKQRPILGLDLDNSVFWEAQPFLDATNDQFNASVPLHEYSENHAKMWGVSPTVANKRTEWWHASGHIADLPLLPDAYEVLGTIHETHDIVPLTSRRFDHRKFTYLALAKTGLDAFLEPPIFTGFYRSGAEGKVHATKVDILQAMGAEGHLDDMLKHLGDLSVERPIARPAHPNGNVVDLAAYRRRMARRPVHGITMGNYHWNQADRLPDKVVRANNWLAALDHYKQHFAEAA